jgi:hypothetical protein
MDGLPPFPNWDVREAVMSTQHFLPGEWRQGHKMTQAMRPTDIEGLQLGIGQFRNSEDADSLYAGLRQNFGPAWIEGGVATGYSGAPVVPMARAGIDIGNLGNIFAAPAYDVDSETLGALIGATLFNLEW